MTGAADTDPRCIHCEEPTSIDQALPGPHGHVVCKSCEGDPDDKTEYSNAEHCILCTGALEGPTALDTGVCDACEREL